MTLVLGKGFLAPCRSLLLHPPTLMVRLLPLFVPPFDAHDFQLRIAAINIDPKELAADPAALKGVQVRFLLPHSLPLALPHSSLSSPALFI